jgi:hypothetical protein
MFVVSIFIAMALPSITHASNMDDYCPNATYGPNAGIPAVAKFKELITSNDSENVTLLFNLKDGAGLMYSLREKDYAKSLLPQGN